MSKILKLTSILLLIGRASSYYSKSYDGYTLILPGIEKDRSSSKPMKLSFSEAQSWCKKNVTGSTLATIRNKDVQRDFSQFITSALQDNRQLVTNLFSNIRLNGKYHVTDKWRWVNDYPKADHLTVRDSPDERHAFYARAKNLSIYSTTANKTGRFICEYPVGIFNQCSALLNERCYKKYIWSFTWYEARNNCSGGGGDLASFETLSDANIKVVLRNLYLDSNSYYWIGLQKNDWRWDDTDSTIKYTNWAIHRPSNYSLHCLCITRFEWEWKECDCSKPRPFICMLNDSSATTNVVVTIIIVVCCVVILIIVVVIIIVVAALIVKKRGNSDAPRSVGVKSSDYKNPEYSMTDATKDFPVYSEIQDHNRETNAASNTTYAKVEMAANTNEEYPVNGIVYADLDLTPRS